MNFSYKKITWLLILIPGMSTFAGEILQANESVKLTGMYSYWADVGLFTACGQTKRLSVAQEGDNAALEKAYLKHRYMPGKILLVTFIAHTARHPKMEGNGEEEVIVVDKFLSINQQERCTGSVPPSSLGNTYWKLVEMEGQRLDENDIWLDAIDYPSSKSSGSQRDIHFIIKNNGDSITGFSGCNQFSGNVSYDEKNIQIGPLMSTRMACPAMTIESQFHNLITVADNYRIEGESLELLQDEDSVAKFIAIYF